MHKCVHEHTRVWLVTYFCTLTWEAFTVIWPFSRQPLKAWVTLHTRSPGRTLCTKFAGKKPTLSPHLPWKTPQKTSLSQKNRPRSSLVKLIKSACKFIHIVLDMSLYSTPSLSHLSMSVFNSVQRCTVMEWAYNQITNRCISFSLQTQVKNYHMHSFSLFYPRSLSPSLFSPPLIPVLAYTPRTTRSYSHTCLSLHT